MILSEPTDYPIRIGILREHRESKDLSVPNSFGMTSFADHHPLTPLESNGFKKGGGGRGRTRAFPLSLRALCAPTSVTSVLEKLYSPYLFLFQSVPHSFPQRRTPNSFAINRFRTLSITMGGAPMSASFAEPSQEGILSRLPAVAGASAASRRIYRCFPFRSPLEVPYLFGSGD